MSRKQTEIFSIFGQIDAIVAEQMIEEGKARRIEKDMIPATASVNSEGRPAQFAIVIDRGYIPELERRTKDLYA